jgi:hypothetical protein
MAVYTEEMFNKHEQIKSKVALKNQIINSLAIVSNADNLLGDDAAMITDMKAFYNKRKALTSDQAIKDDCDAAIADDTRLLSEGSAKYTTDKTDALKVVTMAKTNMDNLVTLVNAEGNHGTTEKAEYTKTQSDMATLIGA